MNRTLGMLVLLTLAAYFFPSRAPCQAVGFQPSEAFSTQVIRAFKQGRQNDFNCASIALIKLSMAQFGPEVMPADGHEGVLVTADKDPSGGLTVQLRDGSRISLSSAELAEAASRSGFTIPVNADNPGNVALRDRANVLYAVMAKKAFAIHAEKERFSRAVSYSDAIKLLQNGLNFEELTPLLGLVVNQLGDADNLASLKNVAYVYTNNWHAVFGSNDFYDEYGSPERVSSFNAHHKPWYARFRRHSDENWAFGISRPEKVASLQ